MKSYIVFPVNNNVEAKDVTITSFADKSYGLSVHIDAINPQYYAYVDVSFLGEIRYVSLNEKEYSFTNEKPSSLYHELKRPKIHYTVSSGWNNDPNGMIYYDGIYHMFYQYNPAGNRWGNMHWGHATSADMIHYKEEDIALFPDHIGAIYSGSAIVDYDNVNGLKENENDPIILFYTSAGYRFNQCIAYSIDKGKTFKKYKNNPIIPCINFWNRDPKVIKCEELNCYIMALFLQDEFNNFILLKSTNLLNWKVLQKVRIANDWECPDIYKLKAIENGEEFYILQGACGSYLYGKIKNGLFEFNDTPAKCLYGDYIDYAAQSFSNIPGRVIQVNWQKSIVDDTMHWGSNLSLPQEVTLHLNKNGQYELHTYIAKEFDNVLKKPYLGLKPDYDCGYDIKATIKVNETSKISCFGVNIPLPDEYKNGTLDVRIIIDTCGITFYINEGVKYTSIASMPNYDLKPLVVENGSVEESLVLIVDSFIK